MKRKIDRDTSWAFILCVLVLFLVSLPLFSKLLFPGHDTLFHIKRILLIAEELQKGQFPVRIYSSAHEGYGYGAPMLYPDIFLYLPAVWWLCGLPIIICYNLFLIVINLATLASSFYAFSVICRSRFFGLMSSFLYVLSIYRLVDLYLRGSVGEFLALIFCPLCLCGLVLMQRSEVRRGWKVLAFGFAGLLMSHVLTFLMMVIVAVLFVLLNLRKFLRLRVIAGTLLAAGTAVLADLWFLIPFLQQSQLPMQVMSPDGRVWSTGSNVVQILDLLMLTAGGAERYGKSVGTCMTKTVGIPLLLGWLFYVLRSLSGKKKEAPASMGRYGAAGMFAVFMTMELFPWGLIRKIDFLVKFVEKFQFLWRINVIATLFLAPVAAYGWYWFFYRNREKREILLLTTLVSCFCALIFLNQFIQLGQQMDEQLVRTQSKMDHLYCFKGSDLETRQERESNAELIWYQNYIRGDATVSFHYSLIDETDHELYIDVPINFYHGYQAWINEEPAVVTYSERGMVRVMLPAGVDSGQLMVKFVVRRLYRIADLISACTLLACVVCCIISFGKNKLTAARMLRKFPE